MNDISTLLKLRLDAGMTQAELSRRSGVNTRQIRSIERGEIKIENVTLANAAALASVFGIHAEDLLKKGESKMNEIYLTTEIFEGEIPDNATEILEALNHEIDAFVSKNGLEPDLDDDDFDTVVSFADALTEFYHKHGTPDQAAREGFRIISNAEITEAVEAALEERGLEWQPVSGHHSISAQIDMERDPVEEFLPDAPNTIELFIEGFIADCEAIEDRREAEY